MKSGETLLVLRALIVRGGPAMALLGLVACATTATTPVSRQADPAFARKVVTYPTPVPPGTIVIDPGSHFLYLVQGGGQAIRYGVGVGGEGFGWSGSATVHSKQEWPDWYPPTEMLQRKPEHKADSPNGPPVRHRISPERVTQELKAAGYTLVDTLEFLPRQYCLVFDKGNS